MSSNHSSVRSLAPNRSNFLKHDGPAGLVVFLVALPLCLGVAHASGAPLFAGIIAGIVGGCMISLLSVLQISVSGPTPGLLAIVAAAIQTLGSYQAFLATVLISKRRVRMVHVELSDIYEIKYILLWSLLSFKAGLLNSAGFLIVGSFVSHVTGFGTQIGIELVHSDYVFSIELLIIPIAFIGGAVLTSLVLDKAYSKGNIPPYPIIQLLITLLLGIISVCFSIGIFDLNTMNAQHERTIFFLGLLCLTCGLKNGLTTWATQGKIRTTHLTGLSTDIGLHLPKIFRPEGSHSRYPEPRKVTYVRIVILLSFSIGACLSAVLIPRIGDKLFYLAFVISTVLCIVSFVHRRRVGLLSVSTSPGQVCE